MSDDQLRKRLIIKRLLFISAFFLLCAGGLLFYYFSNASEYQQYMNEKAQESGYQSRIEMLTNTNNQLLATIEENGKRLVSFTEDRIKYINLASELSLKYNVRINKLAVSDVWDEGEMAGMTTAVELQGGMDNLRKFITDYCGTNYVNRVNVVSCRPVGRYTWLTRNIDGNKVLGWFDTSPDESLYRNQMAQLEAAERALLLEQGVEIEEEEDIIPITIVPVYDPETQTVIDLTTGVELTQEEIDKIPITIDTMFVDKPMILYLVVDFLGRS